MYTFAQFVEKKLQEQQAPPAQPAKPGAPAAPATAAKPGTPATQQPPKMNPQQRTQLLATVNKAVTGVVDNALKQLKLT